MLMAKQTCTGDTRAGAAEHRAHPGFNGFLKVSAGQHVPCRRRQGELLSHPGWSAERGFPLFLLAKLFIYKASKMPPWAGSL